ncbi:MAG TPA: hypothetical protein VHL55_02720, partial [Acidimicrobiia bacterium]|nr:hypothetical protein [Acidimicrobiia bacterium]
VVLAGERTEHRGTSYQSVGFRSGLGRRTDHITVAAAGSRMIRAATRSADRIVANLVTPERAALIRNQSALPMAVWVMAAVEPTPLGIDQIRRHLVLYLTAPGYRETLREAGMGPVIDRVAEGARPKDVASLITTEMISAIAAIGSLDEVASAVAAFEKTGSEVMVVPVTADDEGGARTLRGLA